MPDNRLNLEDRVRVDIINEDGQTLRTVDITGMHRIEEAILKAVASVPSIKNPEYYVFRVTDLSNDTSRRYRLNVHGNLKLII